MTADKKSSKSAEREQKEFIMELIRADEGEEAILLQLEEAGLRDVGSRVLVRKVISEFQVAKSLMPKAPPRKRIRLFGGLMVVLGLAGMWLSLSSDTEVHERYDPSGYGLILVILGVVLFVWPIKPAMSGIERRFRILLIGLK